MATLKLVSVIVTHLRHCDRLCQGIIFHGNNNLPKVNQASASLQLNMWEFMEHPPYSPFSMSSKFNLLKPSGLFTYQRV